MSGRVIFHLSRAFLRIFLRDRQALIFGLLFPAVLLSAFALFGERAPQAVPVGVVHDGGALGEALTAALRQDHRFQVITGPAQDLAAQVRDGEIALVIEVPSAMTLQTGGALPVRIDGERIRTLGFVLPVLREALTAIGHELRGTAPLFALQIEDVDARTMRYLDFVLPGILAFTLMQISLAGSGYNLVEYRRKGILRRLFVTPVRPGEFILSLGLARLVFCLVQLVAVLVFAVFVLDVQLHGQPALLLAALAGGCFTFLCLGFVIGSLASTQQAIAALGSLVTFPQIVLAGVFFPIGLMPDWLQPAARALPLSFLVELLRGIVASGEGITELAAAILGLLAWSLALFLLAARMFSWQRLAT